MQRADGHFAPAICTIISKNYLAHARSLVDSFLEHHPDGQAYVLLTDRLDGYFDPGRERFTTITVEELGIPGFASISFRYTQLELNTAVKPFFLAHLLTRLEVSRLCYFDPDIVIAASLEPLFGEFDSASILLTPHLLDVLDDGRYPGELDILQAGAFNLGFIGVSRCEEVLKFLRWWGEKLLVHGSFAPASGLFVDQRWIDLAPSLFAGVRVLRDSGYNVAYWNLSQREVRRHGDGLVIGDAPVRFFHFSGFNPDNVREVSRHQNRFTLDDLPELAEFFSAYLERLNRNGLREVRGWPYAFATFDDGVAIPDAARHAYREADPAGTHWPDPFATTTPRCFRAWLNEDADPRWFGRWPLSRLALQIFRERPDLQKAFPDVLGQHRPSFSAWFVANAESRLGLAPCFVEPMRRAAAKVEREGGDWSERGDGSAAGARAGGAGPSRAADWRRALIMAGFRLNNSWIGRSFRRVAGRGASRRLKQALLALGAQPTTWVPPHEGLGTAAPAPGGGRAARWHGTSGGLNVIGYLRSENGVGEVARGTLRALAQVGYPVAKTAIELNDTARKEADPCAGIPEGTPYAANLLHVNADQVPSVVEALGRDVVSGRRNIGYWFWETSSFPAQWHDRFRTFDELWVASSFLQAALAPSSPVPVVRMRPCVEVDPAPGVGRSAFGLPDSAFLFLFTFDPFSIPERKNPLALVEAFRRAFGSRPRDVMLVFKVSQLDRLRGFEGALGVDPAWAGRFAEAVASVSGTVLDTYLHRRDLHALYASCDAFVSLHRSEGFGLNMAEAMLLGKPCIATAYSANMEFMTPSNSYLVDYRLQELDRDVGPYTRGSVWAEPDLEHAAALMRRVFEQRDEARARGANAKRDIQQQHARRPVGDAMAARLLLLDAGEAP